MSFYVACKSCDTAPKPVRRMRGGKVRTVALKPCCSRQQNTPDLVDWIHTDNRVLPAFAISARVQLGIPGRDDRCTLRIMHKPATFYLRTSVCPRGSRLPVLLADEASAASWRTWERELAAFERLTESHGSQLAAIELVHPGTIERLEDLIAIDWRPTEMLPEDMLV